MLLEELKEIDCRLELISNDLDIQFSAITIDSATFHKNMLQVASKHPEAEGLIQFIVFVNDRLETNQTLYRSILLDSLKNLIKQKQNLIKRLIVEAEQKDKTSLTEKLGKFLKEHKITLIVMAVTTIITAVVVSLLVVPTETLEAIKLFSSFSSKGSK